MRNAAVSMLAGWLLLVLSAVAHAEPPTSVAVLNPYQSGNALYEATHNGVETCGTFAFKIDPPVSGLYPTAEDVANGLVFPLGSTPVPDDIAGVISFTLTGDTVAWSIVSPYKVCAVIVKGGPIAKVYYYSGGASSGSGLTAPTNPNNKNNKPYGVSHVTFLFWKGEQPQECWAGETAWASGPRYTNRGNWATYTPYSSGSTVVVYAGQTMAAGTVLFSQVSSGQVTLTITLNSGWRFQDVADNVKIQDYATAPSGNPSPGLFAWKAKADGSPFSITVPANNYYGIHLDVERRVACPMP